MIRALRRHQDITHMLRRLKEDQNQHFNDLTCPCHTPHTKAQARFKSQPKLCSCYGCGNPRRYVKGKDKLTTQELKAQWRNPNHITNILSERL